jgi:hypothetical protein
MLRLAHSLASGIAFCVLCLSGGTAWTQTADHGARNEGGTRNAAPLAASQRCCFSLTPSDADRDAAWNEPCSKKPSVTISGEGPIAVNGDLELTAEVKPDEAQGGTYTWSQVTGPPNGTATFNPADPTTATTVKFSATVPGVYTVNVYYVSPESETCSTVSQEIVVLKVDLEPVAAGNTPDLTDGRICINAQTEYKKAKWKAVVKPSGTATVTPVSGGVTVTGGAGLSDGDTFWVEGGTTVGDYEIKITHDSLATCTATASEKVFTFVKEETYNPKNITEDYVSVGSTTNYPPSYNPPTRNVDNCTSSSVDFETIAGLHLAQGNGADFTVRLSGDFGVTTEPAGVYAGEVKATLECVSSGSMTATGEPSGVAYYPLHLDVDGINLLNFYENELGTSSAPGSHPWNKPKTSAGVKFTCGAKDGSLYMADSSSGVTVGAHSCAQNDGLHSAQTSRVEGHHTIGLTSFEITP